MGEFSPAEVAERFRDIFISEETGSLEVHSSVNLYAVRFHQGLLVGADSAGNPPDGDVAGTATDLSRDVVDRCFACIPDRVEFKDAPPSAGESQGDVLRTVEALLSGVRLMSRFETIHEAMLASEHRLVLKPNPSVPLEGLALKPIHGFLLSRLDGSFSFSELGSTLAPVEESEAVRFIFALLLLGSVALNPPLSSGPFRTELLLADHLRDAARARSEIAFIRDLYAALQTQNPYEMLGLRETATSEDVERAHKERRQACGSDRFLVRVRGKMRHELRIIDCRLTEAYMALTTGGVRDLTASVLAGVGDAPDFDSLALRREVTKTDAAASIDEQERLAEQYYMTAKKYFNQADFHNCIQYSTLAIKQAEQVARYHLLLGEAQARNGDHRWQKAAERSFLRATQLDPWSADYLVILGQFYKRQGLRVRARRQFERAIEIQPGHPRAKEELSQLRSA